MNEYHYQVFIILLITTLILPIGLFIGVGVYAAADADPEKSDVVNGVLQSIATGLWGGGEPEGGGGEREGGWNVMWCGMLG